MVDVKDLQKEVLLSKRPSVEKCQVENRCQNKDSRYCFRCMFVDQNSEWTYYREKEVST